MSKKNKDIEVRVEEEKAQYNGANVLMNKLFIGRVIPQNDKKFIIEIDGKQEGTAKNLDEAFETIIRQWNLSE